MNEEQLLETYEEEITPWKYADTPEAKALREWQQEQPPENLWNTLNQVANMLNDIEARYRTLEWVQSKAVMYRDDPYNPPAVEPVARGRDVGIELSWNLAYLPKIDHASIAAWCVMRMKENYCFAEDSGEWLHWNSKTTMWEVIREADILNIVENCIRERVVTQTDQGVRFTCEAGVDIKRLEDFEVKTYNTRTLAQIVEKIILSPLMRVKRSDFDRDPAILNTPSGIWDLRTLTFRERTREDFVTLITKVDPIQEDAPEFDSFLREGIASEHLDDAVFGTLEGFGIALLGDNPYHRMVWHIGASRSGKSTLLNVFGGIMGSYATEVQQSFITKNYNRQFGIVDAGYRGKRYGWVNEFSEDDTMDTRHLKNFTSGGEIACNIKYVKEPVVFTPVMTLHMATNELPKMSASDKASFNRLIVIRWNHTTEHQNPSLGNELIESEGGKILWQGMKAAQALITEGFYLPQSLQQNVEDVEVDSDNVDDWLEWEQSKLSPGIYISASFEDRTPLNVVYNMYKSYCAANKTPARRQQNFYGSIEERYAFIKKEEKQRPRYWVSGIKLGVIK